MLQTDFEEVYDPAGFELVHIDTDNISAAALHAHWDVHNPTFPVLVGCGSLYNSYGDGYIPYNVVIDTEGIVRHATSGFDETAIANVIEQYISVPFPLLGIESLTVAADDNNDQRPDGGESIEFALSLRASVIGVAATSISVTMTTTDPSVTITNPTVQYPGAAPGEVVTSVSTFGFTVAAEIEPHWATFNFNYSAVYAGGTQEGVVSHLQRMGRPALLVVDSDGGLDDNETFMTNALEALAVNYDKWDAHATPLAALEMSRYSRIYWLGGINQNDVTDDEELGLRDFLNGGGQLLLSSQYMSSNPDRADFLAEFFGVTVTNPNAGSVFVIDGMEGEPWFGETAMVISGSQGANNNQQPDVLQVDGTATPFYTWRQVSGTPPAAAYSVRPNYSVMFFGYPVEATRVIGSVAGSMNMQTFLEHVGPFFENASNLPTQEPVVARDFRLTGAYPNPFNPTTTLEYQLARTGDVSLVLSNSLGQEVLRIKEGPQAAGLHMVTLDGSNWASGLYLAQLVVDGVARDTHKLMLIK